MPRGLGLTPDGGLLFAGRALRTFGFGYLSVILALYLARRGLSAPQIGAILTATLIEDALFTTLVSAVANRVGRRRILILSPLLITLAGLLLAVAKRPWLLMAAAVIGTLSPAGQEAGPFSPLEQAALPGTVRRELRTRAFAWYNICGFFPAALGALVAGAWMGVSHRIGLTELTAYQWLLWLYAASGLALSLLYARLSPAVEVQRSLEVPVTTMGLHKSRGIVFRLASLQAVDAMAGGLVVQSLLVYWFHVRFGVGLELLGPLFFGTNLFSAVSFLVAARAAERFGLLNTMVFSHLPSNVLLALVPLAPSLLVAAVLLLTRHLLSQMDVPTRQAYIMALVAPDERSAAAGFTASARAMAQATTPLLAGMAMARAATGVPFFLAGGLKIVYDLALLFIFRRVPLPQETD
jgi:MFS family permease